MQYDITERVRRFFDISSLKCSCCNKLGHLIDESKDFKIERSSKYFGIETIEDWQKKVDEEFIWLHANSSDVLAVLPKLEKEWPESCEALREVLEGSEMVE